MDQPVAAQSSETIDEILDDVSENQIFRRIDRSGTSLKVGGRPPE